ncbi:ejaculatory bulb-specific protein 3-like [Lycorma delicatula]|uniref:ejaculatory bulb-specific protein 3-like n=1 Tax=Lycorma delicatula TaxID=130591 RepID=UPI003F51593F
MNRISISRNFFNLYFCLISLNMIYCEEPKTNSGAVNRFNSQFYGKVETFNIPEVLDNSRLLKNYVYCIIDKGPCTANGRKGKVIVKDLMETGCEGCSEKLDELLRKSVKKIHTIFPEEWDILLEKYDPTGKNRINMTRFMDKENK